jgi:predicted DNA-binding transcriptional regulator
MNYLLITQYSIDPFSHTDDLNTYCTVTESEEGISIEMETLLNQLKKKVYSCLYFSLFSRESLEKPWVAGHVMTYANPLKKIDFINPPL